MDTDPDRVVGGESGASVDLNPSRARTDVNFVQYFLFTSS